MPIFLYTDIEGSTQLWEKHGQAMGAVLDRHDHILMHCIEKSGGEHVKNTGDGMMAVFHGNDVKPLDCALAMQRRLAAEVWPDINELRIRVAVHAGPAEYRAGDYFGPVVNRVARLLSTAWGGQIILTPAVIVSSPLPENASLQDLGVHLLKDLSEPQQVFGLLHEDLPLKEFPALRSMSSQPNNLPRQPTPLVGREEDLVAIDALLAKPECRLLTLVAPGGMGKTRLGLQVAAEQIDSFRHGVFFIPLAGTTSADNIPATIANALKLSFYGVEDLESQLHNYLREKQLLLLLDNFEHLIDGAGIVAKILSVAPEVKVLVTSRRQLRLHAEWLFDVHGLPVPGPNSLEVAFSYGAVELFQQSARRVQPQFSPNEADLLAIIQVCRLVEGMPLALELAAAWVKTLSCQEIADEIKQDLDLLTTQMQDIPMRQRSVRAVFEHSWNDLSKAEKASFRKLSVFRGGFTREAALTITGASIRILSELINKSLLTRDTNSRFQVHELLRQYAAEKLEEDEATCRVTQEQHAIYYCNFLMELQKSLIQGARSEPIIKVDAELDNVLLAWNWAIEECNLSLLEDGLRSLFWYFEAKAWYFEGEEAFKSAAEAIADSQKFHEGGDGSQDALLSNLRIRQAWFASRLSRYKEARNLLGSRQAWFDPFFSEGKAVGPEQPVSIDLILAEEDPESLWVNAGVEVNTLYGLGNFETARRFLEWYDGHFQSWPWARAQNTANLGRIAGALGEYDKARQLLQEALEILRPLGDQVGVMLYLHTLGGILRVLGDARQAGRLFQESLELAELYNYPMGRVLALGDLGSLAYEEGEYKSAKDYFESSLLFSEEIGDNRGRALALTNLGRIATALGEYDEARRLFEQGLAITVRSGNRRGTALTLNRLCQVHLLLGDSVKAEELCQDSLGICRELGYQKGAALAQISRGEIALHAGQFEDARKYFQTSLEASQSIGFVLGSMRSQIGLGRTAFGLGELDQAQAHLRQGLILGGESRQQRADLSALFTLAETLIASDDPQRGIILLALAANHPAADLRTWEQASQRLELLKDGYPPAEFVNLVARGRELTLDKVREQQVGAGQTSVRESE